MIKGAPIYYAPFWLRIESGERRQPDKEDTAPAQSGIPRASVDSLGPPVNSEAIETQTRHERAHQEI